MVIVQTTFVLLYTSVAGICKVNIPSALLLVISGMFSSVNVDPLTVQTIEPPLALQVKLAVDPNVALTDVGVLMKARV